MKDGTLHEEWEYLMDISPGGIIPQARRKGKQELTGAMVSTIVLKKIRQLRDIRVEILLLTTQNADNLRAALTAHGPKGRGKGKEREDSPEPGARVAKLLGPQLG